MAREPAALPVTLVMTAFGLKRIRPTSLCRVRSMSMFGTAGAAVPLSVKLGGGAVTVTAPLSTSTVMVAVCGGTGTLTVCSEPRL